MVNSGITTNMISSTASEVLADENVTRTEQCWVKPNHMNHKSWKAYLKKLKRKEKRQAAARERDKEKGKSPSPATDSEEERERARQETESRHQHQLWLEREKQAQLAFQAKKEWEEKERKRKEEIERKIREEWEERERKERTEQEEREKKEQEKKQKQDKLLKEATANENTDAWHNPIAPVQYSVERQVEHCPFFKKTAACRFGDHCSRYHDYPESSTTILFPNMFSSFELEQSVVDNIDTDVSLEYDDNDLYHSFKEFYADIIPEFKKVGMVVQVKVCCNYEPHLRGNVYVQYKRESAAQKAYEIFNARWYGGRQLTCVFVNIESWKSAICGLAFKKRCPKGKSCNFLHVFRNPGGEFSEVDYDQKARDHNERWNDRRRQYSNYGENQRDRSRSESVRSHHSHRHSRSKSRERRPKKRYRSRSKSRSPSRSSHSHCRHTKSRSPSRKTRSDRSKSRSRHKSRSLSGSPRGSRFQRTRSRSPNESSDRFHKEHSKSPRPYSSYGHNKQSSSLNSSSHDLHDDRNHSSSRSSRRSPYSNNHHPRKSSSQISHSRAKSSISPSSSSSSSPSHSSSSPEDINQSQHSNSSKHVKKTKYRPASRKRRVTDSEEETFEYVEKTKETVMKNK